jgi:DNA mismatch endonuclease (patch repair protein)
MTDRLSPAQRSRNMARIRGANTGPERILRSGLHRAGLRFRVHRSDLPGRPDIVLRRHSAAVFVHGCFWHRHRSCRYAVMPKTQPRFWAEKLGANRVRDRRQLELLLGAGWRVLVVWECALRNQVQRDETIACAARWIRSSSHYAEIPSEAKG